MPFEIPKLSDERDEIFREFQARFLDRPILRQSNIGVASDVFAGLMDAQYGFLGWIAEQVIPDTAETEFLERWAAIWDLSRKPAVAATGNLDFTGLDGVEVPVGVELSRADGGTVHTIESGTISGGTVRLAVESTLPGEGGNAAPGTEFNLSQALSNVDAQAVSVDGLSGGLPQETDEELRRRLLDRIALPPHGGAAHDYLTWALEVEGVTRAWVRPSWQGAGTVGVAVVSDPPTPGGGSPIPSDTLIQDVADYIEPRRPVTAEVIVFKPTALPVDVRIRALDPDTTVVRNAIEAELAEMIAREGALGTALPLSKVWEAVSLAAGERSHLIDQPAADILPAAHEIPILGAITYV